jgi:hypothetical protein
MRRFAVLLFVVSHLFGRSILASSKVDVLLVVDDTTSAAQSEAHLRLGTSLLSLVSHYAENGIDWKFEVRSLEGRLLHNGDAIESSRLNPKEAATQLRAAIENRGANGAARESFIDGLYPLLDPASTKGPLFRSGSKVVVVLLTGAPDLGSVTENAMLIRIAKAAGGLENVKINALFDTREFGCNSAEAVEAPWSYSGSRYEVLVKATGGIVLAARGDFTRSLLEIAKR